MHQLLQQKGHMHFKDISMQQVEWDTTKIFKTSKEVDEANANEVKADWTIKAMLHFPYNRLKHEFVND